MRPPVAAEVHEMKTGMGRVARMVALVAAGSLLVACGGDDGDDAVDTETETTDEATTSTAAPDETEATEEPEDESDDESGSDVGDVCALLDGVDLSALLGEEAGEPESQPPTCAVRPASAESRGAMQVVVNTTRPADNYETQQELFGVDAEVDGLGEAAFHSGPYLIVLTDGALVTLQVIRDISVGIGAPDADLETAMTTILANLG